MAWVDLPTYRYGSISSHGVCRRTDERGAKSVRPPMLPLGMSMWVLYSTLLYSVTLLEQLD